MYLKIQAHDIIFQEVYANYPFNKWVEYNYPNFFVRIIQNFYFILKITKVIPLLSSDVWGRGGVGGGDKGIKKKNIISFKKM